MKTKRIPLAYPPGELIGEELDARGWKQKDLAEIMGCKPYQVNNIISGRTAISTEIATELSSAFGTSPELWLNLQSAYNLANMPAGDDKNIRRRAEIYGIYKIGEMKKRGWIRGSENVDELESELCHFLQKDSLSDSVSHKYAARKSDDYSTTTPDQEAWLARAWWIAERLHLETNYNDDDESFEAMMQELNLLTTEPEEIRRIPAILGKHGIRFLIVEALPGTKIDGACFWLGRKSPVVALSLRYDRIDNFWFTLSHELKHVKSRDENVVDIEIEESLESTDLPKEEQEANRFAAAFLLDQHEISNFANRHYPAFSAESVEAFAELNNVHPGVVVGQLHHSRHLPYSHLRRFLVKVRKYVIETSITDGYKRQISF